MGYALNIDVGTTNLKVGISDATGELLFHERAQIAIERPIHRAAEHNPDELFNTIVKLIRKLLEQRTIEITCCVISTYQCGLILLDDQLKPLTGVTTLLDTRARLSHQDLKKQTIPQTIYQQTGCPPAFQYPLSRLFYFKTKATELYQHAAHIWSVKAYLMWKLTGTAVSDFSTEGASQLLNLTKLEWNEDCLEILDIKKQQLPILVEGSREAVTMSKEVAQLLGLNNQVPVLAGMYDGASGALGMQALKKNIGVINLGTTGMLRVVSDRPVVDTDPAMRIQTYYLGEDLYFIGSAINNACLPLRWIRNILGNDISYEQLIEEARTAPIGSKKLFFYPFLTGEREWRYGHKISSSFFGLREFHTRSEIARSVLEGVGYTLANICNALKENQVQLDSAIVGGGGSRMHDWLQMLSNIMQLPLLAREQQEASLRGNAYLASCFMQGNKNPLSSVNDISTGSQFNPASSEADTYQNHFKMFNDINEKLCEIYDLHAEFGR